MTSVARPSHTWKEPDLSPDRTAATAALDTELAAFAHGRVPRELRRRQVLFLAEDLFIERGYQAASMDELALRVGVSKPVIYDLIGSKEQLFHTIMVQSADDLYERVAAAVADETDIGRRLYVGALAFFDYVGERRSAWDRLISSDDAPVTTAVAEIRRRQTDLVVAFLIEGTAVSGVSVDPIRLDAAAHAINGAFEALATWWHDHPELTAEELAVLVTALVSPGLDALTTNADAR